MSVLCVSGGAAREELVLRFPEIGFYAGTKNFPSLYDLVKKGGVPNKEGHCKASWAAT